MQNGPGPSLAFELLTVLSGGFAWGAPRTARDSLAPGVAGPLTTPAIQRHLAQHSEAHQDVVDESPAVLHHVNHGIGEDADVEALEESLKAVQPQKHEH